MKAQHIHPGVTDPSETWGRRLCEAQQDEIERAEQNVRLMTAEIDRLDPIGPLSNAAEHACGWIRRSEPSDADVAAIACALFRELARNAHVEINRTAMAALHDIVGDFAPSGAPEEDDGDTDRVQDARRDARFA